MPARRFLSPNTRPASRQTTPATSPVQAVQNSPAPSTSTSPSRNVPVAASPAVAVSSPSADASAAPVDPIAQNVAENVRPMRILQALVDRLDANNRQMRAQFESADAQHQALKKEWADALASFRVTPLQLRTRDEADQRAAESERNSGSTRIRSPPRSAGSSQVDKPKNLKRARPASSEQKPMQSAERNAIERQLRLLNKLQTQVSQFHGVELSAEEASAGKGGKKGEKQGKDGKNAGKIGKGSKSEKGKNNDKGKNNKNGKSNTGNKGTGPKGSTEGGNNWASGRDAAASSGGRGQDWSGNTWSSNWNSSWNGWSTNEWNEPASSSTDRPGGNNDWDDDNKSRKSNETQWYGCFRDS